MAPLRYFAISSLFGGAAAVPAEAHWFEQRVDHFSTSTAVFQQRYYTDATHFAGPGSPIIAILGGEAGISPEMGLYYEWVQNVLARDHGALIIQPEHRFYGESLPFGPTDSFTRENLQLMNSPQAVADYAYFIRAQQRAHNCTDRGTASYCPVLTVGGSYPGFLSAMMRLRYPAVVDMAYAASAPMKFYAQQVGQYDYYNRITESAERAVSSCGDAVRAAFTDMERFLAGASAAEVVSRFSVCPDSAGDEADLADNLLFLAEQTFANLNMANYPPGPSTGLALECANFVAAATRGGEAPLDAIRAMLVNTTEATTYLIKMHRPHHRSRIVECFNLTAQLPAGEGGTARCGDWSGCGPGRDGEMWDYQTCTMNVERISFGSPTQMFPDRAWSSEWLASHCAKRFGVVPQPHGLNDLWGFDEADLVAQASRIVFTNGLNDGWSVGGFLADPAPDRGLFAVNIPSGAHHSDLNQWGPGETEELAEARARIAGIIRTWLDELRPGTANAFGPEDLITIFS